jgi:DNA-binding CsgD family transcriptional regulator
MNEKILSEAIGRIYDCAIDAESWDPALELLRDSLGTPFAAIHMITCTPDTVQQTLPPEVSALHTEWDSEWVKMLPFVMEGIPRIEALRTVEMDQPALQSEVIGPELYLGSRFYSEWLAPQGLVDGCTTTVLRRDLQTAMVSVPIAQGSQPPDAEAVEFMRLLAPHFRRALLISDMLDVHRQRVRVMAEMLDSLSVPVVLVSGEARIEYANAAADALIDEGTCLTGAGGRLATVNSRDAPAFARALSLASAGTDDLLGLWGNGMVVSGRDGASMVVYVLPLGRSDVRNALGKGLAAIFISKDAALPPRVEVLTAVSGLTVAEAEVALACASGATPAEIAGQRGVSLLTIRKQLSSIFEKTGLNTQAGLVAFVHSLASPLRADP